MNRRTAGVDSPDPPDFPAPPDRPDLRALALAAMAWVGGIGGLLLPARVVVSVLAVTAAALLVRGRAGRSSPARWAWLAAAAAVAVSGLLRVEAVATSPPAALAAERAFVTVELTVTSDPRLRQGEHDRFVLVRARLRQVTGRGSTHRSRVPVLVIAEPTWRTVELGSVVTAEGRLSPAEGRDLAAVLSTQRPPRVREPPADVLDSAAVVRAGIRRAAAGADPAARELVPALVVGDDAGLPEDVVEEFRTTGLTHLLAVSGTNLTLVVGFLLVLARWGGVRARGLVAVGLLGVVGFVLLARTEPSVVRAAAMGSVALVGMGSNGREKGTRALGVAVLALLLTDPWWALSPGFALSSLATAGILLLAPPWRDALRRWLPRWAAEALAVPLAAQLACTPVVAALSDEVSLVAVAANVLAAPAVAPATVLGLLGGLVVLAVPVLGTALGTGAGWSASWIVTVADAAARLPTAAVDWPATWASITVLTLLCLLLAWLAPAVLARPWPALATALCAAVVVTVPVPAVGWPPPGWVLVACDVGQGDGLVLDAGEGAAVVVDVGPDPVAIARCLDRLEVERVRQVVLTHFHADHVGGLTGLLREHRPEAVLVTALGEPPESAARVHAVAAAAGVPVRVATAGAVRRSGPLTWQVLGPDARLAAGSAAGEESAANNASVVLLARTRGVTMLLTGDVEPEAQRLLATLLGGHTVDVLKVPHHGSRYQHPELLTGLRPRVAVVSVGEDNDYGHPAPETLALLARVGALVARTDASGDVAVLVDGEGRLAVRTRR